MEYARYSTALKTLSVAVLAGAVVLLGGVTANAATIPVTPENISDQLQSAKDGDVLELNADKPYDGDYTIEKAITIKSAESSRAKVSGSFTIKHSGVSISDIDFKSDKKSQPPISLDGDILDNVTIKDNIFYGQNLRTINGKVIGQLNNLNIEGNYFVKGSASSQDILLVSNRDSKGIRITNNKFQETVQIRGNFDPKALSYVTAEYNGNSWNAGNTTALMMWNNKDTVLNNTTIDDTRSNAEPKPDKNVVVFGGGNKNITVNNMTIKGHYDNAITMSANAKWSGGESYNQENHDTTFNNLNISGARWNGINLYGGNSNVTQL